MNLKGFILSLFIVMSFVGINSLGRFYINEPLKMGQESEMYFTVRNPTNADLDDVNVKMYIYDLGIRMVSNSFDINDKNHKLARIYWIVPESVKTGTYLTKISVGNDYYKDVRHVYLTIV